jgi:hypothetical protein
VGSRASSENGYRWASSPGAACTSNGQPDPSAYTLVFPDGVPDSIISVVVKAFDDLGTEADATITVTKGAPCASAATCATGQVCDQGSCFWNAPDGQLGDTCTYDQFCTSNQCVQTSAGSRCTQSCVVGASDACPSGFDCIDSGVCWPTPHASAGCRATPVDAASPLFAILLIFRRRRRRPRVG